MTGLLMLAACGGSGSASSSVCRSGATAALARFLGVRPARIETAKLRTSSGGSKCNFSTRSGSGQMVSLSVQVDESAQAYCVLERTAEEAAQQFTTARLSPAPVDIPGLGLDADWFPAEQHLLTTDGKRLITATVTWPTERQAQREALAIAAARPYLGRPHPPSAPCPP